MKLTRRLFSAVLAFTLSIASTLYLSACKEKHTHDWSAYSYNATHHWSVCTGCDERKQEEAWHEDDGTGYCQICQHLIPTDGITYALSDDGSHAIVTGCDSIRTEVFVIAPIYNGVPVTKIQGSAFENNSRLTQIYLPASITSIGSSAFSGCKNLMSVFLREKVTEIGENAFTGCEELVIFCEATEKLSTWGEEWNCYCPVYWGHEDRESTPVSIKATPIADSMLRDEKQNRKQIYTNPDLGDMRAPVGFSMLTRYDSITADMGDPWTEGNLWYYNWNQMKLTEYSEVWFAAKVINGYWAFVDGTQSITSSWLYIHIKQTGTTWDGFTLWSIEASVGGQVYNKIENQIGSYVDDNRPTNSIPRLLWDEGFGSPDKNGILIYNIKNGNPVSIYCTEVRGIKIGVL